MRIHGVSGDTEKDGVLDAGQSRKRNRRQDLAIERVFHHWETLGQSRPYPMLALPTGFGKGVIIQKLLRRLPHKKVLLIVGTKNILLDQSRMVLKAFSEQESGEGNYSVFPDTSGNVVLTTWQGLNSHYRRRALTERFGLVIVDEVHNIGTRIRLDILDELSPDAVVGLTATAFRSTGGYRWPEDYGFQIVDAMPLPECIMESWLSPMAGIAIDTQVLLPSDVRERFFLNLAKVNRTLGEYPHLFEKIASEIGTRFLPSGMKTVVIVNRIEYEACVIARILKKMGFKVGLAVNQAKAKELQREFITTDAIYRYKLPPEHPDSIQVLISPQVIGEGFDAPMTECVVWAAPTQSSLRYTQVVGRGTRICPGKKYCLIVDFVYMIENYGYSYNFAQFMPMELLQELPGGIMYVGPEQSLPKVVVPEEFTCGGQVVKLVDLQGPLFPRAGDWVTLSRLAELVGKSIRWTETRVKATKVSPEIRMSPTGPREHYPPTLIETLRKEVETLIPAGGWMTLHAIAAEIGRTQGWSSRAVKSLGIVAEERIDSVGKAGPHYSPEDSERIRQRSLLIPPAGDYLCLEEIAELLGRVKSTPWILARLEELFSDRAEIRLARVRRQETLHYPPDVVDIIRNLQEEEKEAGDWIALSEIADLVGKSFPWTRDRAKELFPGSAEIRMGKEGLISIHYPPDALEAISKAASQYSPAGEWKTILQMAHNLGKSEKWVRTRICRHYLHLAEPRLATRGPGGQLAPHYPPIVEDELRKEVDSTPPAGDWLNLTEIARALGVSPQFAGNKLDQLNIQRESRTQRVGRGAAPHYPPEALQTLREILKQ